VHLRNVDLNLLLIFDALMEERHVTRAGQRVGLTQPAMSSALGRLRHVLQDDVLVRKPAGMEPTPRACELWESIRQILRHTERVLTQTTVFTASTAQRTFRLRMSDNFLLLSMPAIAAHVGREAPQVRLEVVHLSPVQTVAALETDAIDIALSTGLAVPSTIDCLALVRDELVCLVRRDHPQARAPLDMATFLTVHHVKIAHSPLDMRFIDGQLAAQGLARTIGLTVEDWLAVPHIVAGSDLLAVMPRSIAERYTTTCPLVLVPVPFGQHHLTWCLYWHKRHTADAGHRWLRDVLHKVTVGEMSAPRVNASGRGTRMA
jgi:DNA-binding transcriptional LysR family regulator